MKSLLILLTTIGHVYADYPSPQSAGFHHCALIYNRDQRPAADLLPYVAEIREGKPVAWLFDSFLFLMYSVPSGRSPMAGDTQREDWRYHLDTWFAPGRDLAALDEAINAAAVSFGPLPAKRQVVLSIPRPSRAVTDFGDVDGDGASEDLSTAAGLRTVLGWYVTEGKQRFDAAGYKHLSLWGFYWMQETIPPGDEPLTRTAAEAVHAAGLRFSWIPWYRATGWNRWRECGLDVAIMQPNYAFFSVHRGSLRRNRLSVNAHLARERGMGVEIELPMLCNDPQTRGYFLRYLADGAPQRYGYQAGATAYYLGVDNLERLCHSELDWQRGLYTALAAYVRGEAVTDPDPPPVWRSDGQLAPALGDGDLSTGRPVSEAEATLAKPTQVTAIDVFLNEPDPQASWRGVVTVEVRQDGTDAWLPGGWALRTGRSTGDDRWQVVTAPVNRLARPVRVRLTTATGTPPPSVAEIGLDASIPFAPPTSHLACGLPCTLSPASPAKYGDSGRELTDGVIPETGFPAGQTVGWYGQEVAIVFDLGRVAEVDSVELFVEGGGYAAINWPTGAALLTATEGPLPTRTAGTGAPPAGFAWTAAPPVVLDRQRSPEWADGHLVFAPRTKLKARYANLLLKAESWLMVSEVRILSDGANLAPAARYALRPAPTPDADGGYPDDGMRLTDGAIATTFDPKALTGWTDDEPRTLTVDFGQEASVRRVVTWTLAGGLYGIYAPASVLVELSADGVTWQQAGSVARPADLTEDGALKALPLEVASAAPRLARMVRVTVRGGRGWTMLSEVEVE